LAWAGCRLLVCTAELFFYGWKGAFCVHWP
jgi:hypothetical protein